MSGYPQNVRMEQRGAPVTVCSGVTATASLQVDCRGYKSLLLLWSSVGSGGADGQQSLLTLLDGQDGNPVPFHGLGTGIQSAAATTDGGAVFRATTDWVRVEPTITNGCWRVLAIPCNAD